MELDDLKRKARDVKAPEIAASDDPTGASDALVRAIRANDERAGRLARKALPFFVIAGSLYALGCGLFLVGMSSGSAARATHFGMLALVFMVLGILTGRHLRTLRAVDYSRPVKAFLAESERRYRFIRPIELSYSIPLLIVLAVTGGLSLLDALVPRYVGESGRGTVLLVYGAFFTGVCAMGYYFTYRDWKRDKAPIREDIARMRRELEQLG